MDPIARARLNAAIRDQLADLIGRAVKDPRVENVTVTGVQVTSDLSHAKVFWSILGSEEDRRVAERGLRNVAGFLRRGIGRNMRMRNAPELHFTFDASLEHGERIETLLREWHDEAGQGPSTGSASADEEKP